MARIGTRTCGAAPHGQGVGPFVGHAARHRPQGGGFSREIQKLANEFKRSAVVRLLQPNSDARGKGAEALVVLEQAAKLDPNNEDVFAVLGLALLKQNAPEKALPILKQATTLCPDDASLGLALGQAHWRLDDKEKAIEELVEIRKVRPHDIRVILTLAGWLDELGRTAQNTLLKA